MHIRICELVNKTFYKGELQTNVEPKKIRAVALEPHSKLDPFPLTPGDKPRVAHEAEPGRVDDRAC